MKHFYESLYSSYDEGIIPYLKGQPFMSLEIVSQNNLIDFYVVVPESLAKIIEKQITGYYPDIYIEYVPDYNIFAENVHVRGCYFRFTKHFKFPFKTYQRLNSDPLSALTNVFSKLDEDESAVLQIMIRPRSDGWQQKGRAVAKDILSNKESSLFSFLNPLSWLGSLLNLLFRGPTDPSQQAQSNDRTTPLTDEQVKAIEEKNTQVGFTSVIRLLVSSPSPHAAEQQYLSIRSAFAQYSSTDNNSLIHTRYHSNKALAINYIYRNLKRNWTQR